MILQALHALAQREHLIQDPDFEMKPIRWLIEVGPGGTFLGFRDTNSVPAGEGNAPRKGKPKPVAKVFVVPRDSGMNARVSNNYPGPLFDKREYVFGVVEKTPERAVARQHLFIERAESILAATDDEGIRAVVAFLQTVEAGNGPAIPDDCGPGDLFAFLYSPDIDRLVTDRDVVRPWWKAERATPATSTAKLQCLVTGASVADPGLFPKIKRVPGVQGDLSLVSFNLSAFESYGLSSNENAPVSREASEAVATALNRLLHPAFPHPTQPDETLPSRSFRISADTAFCYWSGSDNSGFEDMLGSLLDANPDIVKEEVWRSLWSGRATKGEEDLSPFYGLVLTGTQGRVILRDWFETTISKAQRSVASHFADLGIVRNAPWKKGETPPPVIALRTLLESIAEQGKQENIPAALAAGFVRAAITGCLYPVGMLIRAVGRARAEIGRTEWTDLQRRDARAAIIKAVLNRNYRRDAANPNSTVKEVTHSMDPTNTNEGYVLGCLMAVLERLQQEAIGDVNASVVDKFFSGASAAPRATFDRLVKNARHHARKASDGENAGFVFCLERTMDELMSRINVSENRGRVVGFPLTLPLEQQGLFVIGYHHMRHWLFMSRDDRARWEAEHPDAPRALLWNTRRTARPADPNTAQ